MMLRTPRAKILLLIFLACVLGLLIRRTEFSSWEDSADGAATSASTSPRESNQPEFIPPEGSGDVRDRPGRRDPNKIWVLGRVIHETTRQGIAGAAVGIISPNQSAELTAATDPKGFFEIPLKLAEDSTRYELEVDAEGFRYYLNRSLMVPPGKDLELLIELTPFVRIRGVVRERNSGDPIAEARVRARVERAADNLIVITDSAGTFQLDALPDASVTLQAEHRHFLSGPALTTTAQPDREVMLFLESVAPAQLGSIAGVVTDGVETPIAGARIGLVDNKTLTELAVATSDSGGSFGFWGLRPGNYSLQCEASGYASGLQNWVDVEIATSSTVRAQCRLVASVELAGTVRDPEFRPIPEAEVLITPMGRASSAHLELTDEMGRFYFKGLEPGEALLLTSHPDYASRERPVLLPESTEVDMVLTRGLGLSGWTRNEAGPLQDFQLLLQGGPGGPRTRRVFSFSSPSGWFELRGLQPGSYRLSVVQDGRKTVPAWLSLEEDSRLIVEVKAGSTLIQPVRQPR